MRKAEVRVRTRLFEVMRAYESRTGERLTQGELAERLGMSRGTVDSWVNNRAKHYNKETIEAFCNFFDCTPGDLLALEEVA